MHFKLFLSVCISGLFLAACEFEDSKSEMVKNAKPVEEPPVKPALVPFETSGVKYKVIPLNEPNSYAIELNWPKTDMLVFLRRMTDENFVKMEKGKDFHRFNVVGGTTTTIEIVSKESESGPILNQVKLEVTAPKDIVIDKAVVLSEKRKINCGRFFLYKDAVFQMRNFNVEVNCDELVSDSGIIETFPADSKAEKKGATGQSGGASSFTFRAARGVLYIYLRGETGAAGRNGVSGFDFRAFGGCRGQNGGNGGSTGDLQLTVKEPSQIDISANLIPGRGGIPGEMSAPYGDPEAIHLGLPGAPIHEVCIRAGGTGTPGPSGAAGKLCLQVAPKSPECVN